MTGRRRRKRRGGRRRERGDREGGSRGQAAARRRRRCEHFQCTKIRAYLYKQDRDQDVTFGVTRYDFQNICSLRKRRYNPKCRPEYFCSRMEGLDVTHCPFIHVLTKLVPIFEGVTSLEGMRSKIRVHFQPMHHTPYK